MELLNFEHLAAVLEQFAARATEEYRSRLEIGRTNASGKLSESVEYQVIRNEQTWSVTLSLEDYWKYVENGTGPHWPPRNKILEWIKVKPVIPRPSANGITPSDQSLAFLIQRKIANEGTEGKHHLEKTVDSVMTDFESQLEEALAMDMEENWNAIISSGFRGLENIVSK